MEPLFVVAKIVGSPCKNDNQPFPFKIVLSVIMTTAVESTVAFGNAQITL